MITRLPRTSVSHPIEVDWLRRAWLNTPGRLGLTLAPGQQDPIARASPDGGWDRDLDADLWRLRHVYRARLLVSLLEPFEHSILHIPQATFRNRTLAQGLRWWSFPIVDRQTPQDIVAFQDLIRDLVDELRQGTTIVVHCRAGHGRTGLVAACTLVYLGNPAAKAIRRVRTSRPFALRRENQVQFVYNFEMALSGLYVPG